MRTEVWRLLEDHDGVVTRGQLVEVVPHHVIDRAVSGGSLVRVYPQTYADPELLVDTRTLPRAALAYAGAGAALSHLSGLSQWDLPVPPTEAVHILTGRDRQLRGAPDLLVHRRAGFVAEPPHAVLRHGLYTVGLDQCLIDSWPLLAGDDQRAPMLVAVQNRLTTPQRLLDRADAASNIPGRGELLKLIGLLVDGCRSQLEIWGYLHVFRHPSLPVAGRQFTVSLGARTVYLDVAYPEVKVDVELDGSAYHSKPGDHERDARRDVALATCGWQTLRFTHRRLHAEPDLIRRDVLAVIAARRSLARGG